MVKDLLKDAEERMHKAVDALHHDLQGIRSGRASPGLLERLTVEYYGSEVPLQQMAAISVPEPRQIAIRPWDASTISAIERAILKSDLGLTPSNDGKMIRLNLPQLTEQRRKDLVKVVNKRIEEGRVAIRNLRRDAINDLREMEKEKMISEDDMHRGQDDLQKLTDRYVTQIDEAGKRKEVEITEV